MVKGVEGAVTEYLNHLSGELLSQDGSNSDNVRLRDEALMNSEENFKFLKSLFLGKREQLSKITVLELRDERYKKMYVNWAYFMLGIYELMCEVGMTDEHDKITGSYKKEVGRLEKEVSIIDE